MLIAAESRVWFLTARVVVWHQAATLTPRGAGTQSLTSWFSQLQYSSACLEHYIKLGIHPQPETHEDSALLDSKQHPDLTDYN